MPLTESVAASKATNKLNVRNKFLQSDSKQQQLLPHCCHQRTHKTCKPCNNPSKVQRTPRRCSQTLWPYHNDNHVDTAPHRQHPITPNSSEGQLDSQEGCRCLLRGKGKQGYEDGRQRTCSEAQEAHWAKWQSSCLLLFHLHALGEFGLAECVFCTTSGTQVSAVDCEGGSNVTSGDSKHTVITLGLLGSGSFFSPPPPVTHITKLSFPSLWGQGSNLHACSTCRAVQ